MAVQVVLVAGVVEAAIEQKNIYIETLLSGYNGSIYL